MHKFTERPDFCEILTLGILSNMSREKHAGYRYIHMCIFSGKKRNFECKDFLIGIFLDVVSFLTKC